MHLLEKVDICGKEKFNKNSWLKNFTYYFSTYDTKQKQNNTHSHTHIKSTFELTNFKCLNEYHHDHKLVFELHVKKIKH